MYRIIIIIYLLAMGAIGMNAQPSGYSFYQISSREGLSQSTVQSILLDSKGMLWIGTKGGLNQYSQQHLKVFLHQPDRSTSLPHNRIYHLAEDSLGTVWVSTGDGIATYKNQGEEFTLITRDIAYSGVPVPGGFLWGSDNVLIRYDYQKKNLERIYLTDKTTDNNPTIYRVQSLIPWKDNKVLVGTRQKGIYVFDLSTHTFTPWMTTARALLMSLCKASDGRVYASYYGEGMYSYDLEGNELRQYTTQNSTLNNDYILGIAEHDGKLWLATDGGGINLFPLQGGDITSLRKIPGDASSLPDNSIVHLYKDKEGNLWAGSVREGLFIVKESHIHTFQDVPLNIPYGLSEKTVISLCEESDGSVWIGTDGGGINHYSPHTGRFTHYPKTYGDKVVSITTFSEKELLVSLYTRGVFLFDKHTGSYRPFTIVNEEINHQECFYGFLPFAHRVTQDKIYILSYHPWVYHLKEKKFTALQPASPSLSGAGLTLSYANDTIALCRQGNKVYTCNLKEDIFDFCFELKNEEEITALHLDSEDRIWTGSGQGLGYYSLKEKRFHYIATGLFNSVSFLTTDSHGKMWICAENRLFTYDTANNRFTTWNTSDGYLPNEIIPCFQQSANPDFLYLGGSEGLVSIRSRKVDFQNQMPVIFLADLYWDGASCKESMEGKTAHIPWNYHSLKMSVQVKTQDIFQKNLIRYIIREGNNERYTDTYDTELNLATLSPGNYSVWASCHRKDGSIVDPVHLLDVVVTPPWFQSTWFVVMLLLLLIAGGFGLFAYQNHRKEETMKRKMKVYKHRMDEEKINFLININHELRTPLTLIYAPLKRLADKSGEMSEQESHHLFRIVYNQAIRMKNIINMVLDMNRLESGGEQVKMQQHVLNEWVQRTVSDFSNEWNERHIQMTFHYDERIGNVWFDEWKCQIVLSNLLMNALKFSGENTEITISTQRCEGKVRVSVSDQGIGLAHTDINKLFTRFYEGKHTQQGSGIGLSYARKLMEVQGGSIHALNNPERGATFYFELPLETSQAAVTSEATSEDLAMQTDQSAPAIDCRLHTLLVVEDEDELRQYLQQALSEHFKQVYAAPNGEEALKLCCDKQPSLVVSDVMMPGMDGYELCRQIKNDIDISHIPVILLTARCDDESVKHGYKQGADFYMAKPFELDFLQTIITNLLRSREAKRRSFSTPEPIATPQEATISQRDEEFLLRLNRCINDNLATEDIRVEYLTDQLAMSRASLYNKVKLLTGLGVNDYINRLRIERAVELLLHTNKPINDIAGEVGFTYPRYFSTLFKKIKGVSPSQFKEQFLNSPDEPSAQ